MDMESSVAAVEGLLGYKFRNKRLLEEALTHSSIQYSASYTYQRLEFVGDAALGLVLSHHLFQTYRRLKPGHLSVLRSANISNNKLARVAIRHDLDLYLSHKIPDFKDKVREFKHAIKCELDEVKAPKFLADIVESIAAAVYLDCEFDLKILWKVFGRILEPIVTMDTLQEQPVTSLYQFCQKQRKKVEFSYDGSKSTASFYVDEKLLGSGTSEQKKTATRIAAKMALQKLLDSELSDVDEGVAFGGVVGESARSRPSGAKESVSELSSSSRADLDSSRKNHSRNSSCSCSTFKSLLFLLFIVIAISYLLGDPKS